MKLKKLLALILALAMVLTSMPLALAEEAVEAPAEQPAPVEELEAAAPVEAANEVIPEETEIAEPVQPAEVTVEKYTVIFKMGPNDAVYLQLNDQNGDDFISKPDDPQKTGYSFTAWTGVEWNAETQKSTLDIQHLADENRVVTLTATWAAKDVAITYDKGIVPAAENMPVASPLKYDAAIEGNPTCAGYDFNSWSPATVNQEDALTTTAQWIIHKFDITFAAGAGGADVTLPANKTNVDYGTEISETPTWAGHTFAGWAIKGADPVKTFTAKDELANAAIADHKGTIEAIAIWGIETVTFMVDGAQYGDVVSPAAHGGTVAKPTTDPSKKGYNFDGWYLGEATTSFDFNTPITESIVLNAKFSAKDNIPVTFETEATGDVPAPTTATFDQPIGDKLPDVPEVPGKQGGFWYVKGDASKTPVDSTYMITEESVTFVASYGDIQYQVTFAETKDSKFINDTAVAPIPGLKYGNKILPVNEIPAQPAENTTYILPLKGVANYDFAGWYYDHDGKATTDPIPLPQEGIELAGNLTLIAYWNCYYTVKFVNTGDNGYKAPDGIKVPVAGTVGTPVTLLPDGNYFAGEYRDPHTVDEISYYDGWFIGENEFFFAPSDNATELTGDTTIEAKWYDLYKVTFDFNGATAKGTSYENDWAFIPDGYSFNTYIARTKKAEGYLLPKPTKTNNSFLGWKLIDELFDDDDVVTGNITIVADFGVKAWEVTVNPNGGKIGGSTETITKKVTDNHTWAETYDAPADPVYTDHVFLGWFTGTEANPAGFNFATTKITDNTTVWAMWTEAEACIGKPAEQTAATLFAKLADALDRAENKDTVYLLKDVTLDVPGGKLIDSNITLDLNGKTLDGHTIRIDADVTIKNGKLINTELNLTATGKVTLASGTYETVKPHTENVGTVNIEGSTAYFDEATAKALSDLDKYDKVDDMYVGGFIPEGYGLKKTATSSGYYVLVKVYTLTFDMNIEDDVPADAYVVYPADKKTEKLNVEVDPEKPAKDPERENYYLLGWYKEAECKNEFTFGEVLTANTTVYAKWGHSVTFNWTAKEGEFEVEKHEIVPVEHGKKVANPGAPEDFVGEFEFWGTNENGVWTQFDFDTAINENKILTAKSKWKVVFKPDNGQAEWTEYVTNGGQVTNPGQPDPVEGFTFTGWYNYNTNVPYVFTNQVTSDLVLVAKWNNSNWVISKIFDAVATVGKDGGTNREKTELLYSGIYEIDPIDPDNFIILKYQNGQEGANPINPELPTKAGYFVGYQFEAPSTVTLANASQYGFYYNNKWVKLNTVTEPVLSANNHVVINMFEEVQLEDLKALADIGESKTFEYRFALWADQDNYVAINVTIDPNNIVFFKNGPVYDILHGEYIFDVDFDTEFELEEPIEKQHIESTDNVVKPENPVEDHHIFKYWTADNPYDDKGVGNWRQYKDLVPAEYNFGNPVYDDMTLYAYWVDAATLTLMCDPADPTKNWAIQLESPITQAKIAEKLTDASEVVVEPTGKKFNLKWNDSESGQLFAQGERVEGGDDNPAVGDLAVLKWTFERDPDWVLDYDMTLEPVFEFENGATVKFQEINWDYASDDNDLVVFADSYPAGEEVTIDNHPDYPGEMPENRKWIGWSTKRLNFNSMDPDDMATVYEGDDWTKTFVKKYVLKLYAQYEDRFLVNFYADKEDEEPIATLGFMDRGTEFEDLTSIPDGPAGPEGTEFVDWQLDWEEEPFTLAELIEEGAYIDYNLAIWHEGYEDEEGNWVDSYQEIKMYAKYIPTTVTLSVMDGDEELYNGEFNYNELDKAGAQEILAAEVEHVVIPEGQEFVGWVDEDGVDFEDYADDWTLIDNLTLTAQLKSIEYKISFVNYDGTELVTIEVPYGDTPEYPEDAETPTKEGDQQYSYTFNGWDPALAPVDGEATYTATYTEEVNKYLVTFDYGEGEATVVEVEYGSVIPEEEIPEAGEQAYWTAADPETWLEQVPEAFDFEATEIEDDLTLYAYTASGTVIVKSFNLMFEGIIQLRVRYDMSKILELENPGNVEVYLGDELIKTIPIKDYEVVKGMQAYFIDVPVKQYADTFTLRVVDANGNDYKTTNTAGTKDFTETGYEVSVERYANTILTGEDYSDAMKDLAQALLDYGIASKIQFKYGDYSGLKVPAYVTAVTADEMKGSTKNGDKPEGVKLNMNVDFEADNNVRAIWTLPEGKTPADYTFIGPEPVLRDDGRYQQAYAGIKAKNLGDDQDFGIDDFTMGYSVIAYCRTVVNGNGSDSMKDLAKAMYLYWVAAVAYYN